MIGHPGHIRIDGVNREMIEQTVRSHNAHLSRVQVLTCSDLIDSDRPLHGGLR